MEFSCLNKFKFIYDIDLFGKIPELYYRGKNKKVSLIGTLLTLIYFILYFVIFAYKFLRVFHKKDVNFYETYEYTGETPSINITNEIFYGGFVLGYTPFIDETIYYPKVEYWSGKKIGENWNFTKKDIEIEACQLENFDSKYWDIFRNKPLSNLYCIKDINNNNITLEGNSFMDIYSYFNITIYPCINTTKNGTPCKPLDIIDQNLTVNIFQFYIQDIDLTPQNYYSPTQVAVKSISSPLYKHLYQKIYGYMKVVNIETDTNYIGIEKLSNIKNKKYLKYDNSFIINAPNEGKTYDYGFPLCEIIIQLSDKVLTEKRSIVTLFDIFGDIGGTMEFIFTFFSLIASFSTDKLYKVSLVNNLFSFDIDKKIFLFKINEDKIKKNISDNKINTQEKKLAKYPLDNLYNNKENSKNKLMNKSLFESENLKFPNKKDKTSHSFTLKAYENIDSINKKNNFQKNDNNENITNEFDLDKMKYLEQKEKESKIKNKRIINKILPSKLHCFFCYIFNRKKSLNYLLFDEAKKIIIEKLDIFNIFKKIYKAEKIKSKYIKDNYIKISDECKNILKDIMKKNK